MNPEDFENTHKTKENDYEKVIRIIDKLTPEQLAALLVILQSKYE